MERPILKVLADNPALFDAVKDALIEEFMAEENRTDDALSDEQLGRVFRARITGMQKIESAFRKIARYRSRNDDGPKFNGAR